MAYINQFSIVIFLLILGYIAGTMAESRHYRRIRIREKLLNRIPAISIRIPPDMNCDQVLVSGNIVIANDYFKLFVAGLKGFFGGQLNTYETLLDRGRREAILRMKEEAKKLNARLIVNVKLTTSNLGVAQNKASGSLEVYAYGTALIAK
jgi:uncharacterized protein YbjQ (UPF0145 family)